MFPNPPLNAMLTTPPSATQSGGYSATPEVWSEKSQRGGGDPYYKSGKGSWEAKKDSAPTGAIDQSPSGSDLKSQLEDAHQGNAGTDTPVAY